MPLVERAPLIGQRSLPFNPAAAFLAMVTPRIFLQAVAAIANLTPFLNDCWHCQSDAEECPGKPPCAGGGGLYARLAKLQFQNT